MGRNFMNWLTQMISLKKHYGLLALQVEMEWKKSQSIVLVGFFITMIEPILRQFQSYEKNAATY